MRKYRSIEEMPDFEWLEPHDPRLLERLRFLLNLTARTLPSPPRGLRKYRSIEDAQADRERWERERSSELASENPPHGP